MKRTITSLKKEASEKKIKNRSKMNKEQLMAALGYTQKTTTMSDLPPDVLRMIASKAQLRNAVALSHVNKHMKQTLKDDIVSLSKGYQNYRPVSIKIAGLILRTFKDIKTRSDKKLILKVTKTINDKPIQVAEVELIAARNADRIEKKIVMSIQKKYSEKLRSIENMYVDLKRVDFENMSATDWTTANTYADDIINNNSGKIAEMNYTWFKKNSFQSDFRVLRQYNLPKYRQQHGVLLLLTFIQLCILAQHDSSIDIEITERAWKNSTVDEWTYTVLHDLKLQIMKMVKSKTKTKTKTKK